MISPATRPITASQKVPLLVPRLGLRLCTQDGGAVQACSGVTWTNKEIVQCRSPVTWVFVKRQVMGNVTSGCVFEERIRRGGWFTGLGDLPTCFRSFNRGRGDSGGCAAVTGQFCQALFLTCASLQECEWSCGSLLEEPECLGQLDVCPAELQLPLFWHNDISRNWCKWASWSSPLEVVEHWMGAPSWQDDNLVFPESGWEYKKSTIHTVSLKVSSELTVLQSLIGHLSWFHDFVRCYSRCGQK